MSAARLREARVLADTARMTSLREYRRKRPPGQSPEPRGGHPSRKGNSFVVQRHDATRLHYDFRLEMNGVLKSWAVPKGPSLNPADKRLAIQTEDHPLDYGGFEGTIPEGNYGAGEVILWDKGTYETEGPLSGEEQLRKGELKFRLRGQKLNGSFVLVKLKRETAKNEWLMIKHRDETAQADWDIDNFARSVKSNKLPGPPRHASRQRPAISLTSGVQNLKNAVQAPIPENLRPALAMSSDKPFSSDDWLFEIKWDGIRSLAVIQDGVTELISRSGRSLSAEYPEFRDLAKQVRAHRAVLDGEIVVLDSNGRSNFQKLQSRFGVERPSAKLQGEAPVTYYFFDVLYCDGYDVRRAPLIDRKELLARILITNERVRISEHVAGDGIAMFEAAAKEGLEGIIAKRKNTPYPTGRTSSWLKLKTVRELDAVVGGWTDPRGARQYFGSLLVGLYDKSKLRFIGGVGTGFPAALEKKLYEDLQELATSKCPFDPVPQTRERAHWVVPKLVARVGYAEWTSDNHLRQPRFMGVQPDRPAKESTFEKQRTPATIATSDEEKTPKDKTEKTRTHSSTKASHDLNSVIQLLERKDREQVDLDLDGRKLKLTHLNKVYFPDSGYTKRDVLSYYAKVSPYLIPFLKDRPLVLHRYPNGIKGNVFYQKEAGPSIPEWIRTTDIRSETKGQDVAYFIADDLASLLYMSNLGCIEHNPFSARADDLERPDYMFMDLDPTEGTPFSRVISAAKTIGDVLQKARLDVFLKTSGATGLHMFIPIVRNYGFDQVRAFLEIVARVASDRDKGLLTRTFRVQDRPKNSVFVDVRQNASGQSLASIFSIRPREDAPISTPLSWDELKPSLQPERWNIKTVLKDLPRRSKLWATFWDHPCTLEDALGALEKARPAKSQPRESRLSA